MRKPRILIASLGVAVAGVLMQPISAQAYSTTTKHCGTGGYSYTTDSMYVSRTYLGSGQWRYKVTRSSNRTVTAKVGSYYHYVKHTAVALNQYTNGTVKKVTNPSNTTYMYSRYGNDDFGMWFDVTDGATMNLHKGCYVYF